jgi:hypothetical protein
MLNRPVEIVFHRLDHSPSVENLVLDLTSKLERLAPGVSWLRVVIDTPHRSSTRARYTVNIEMLFHGQELVIHHADPGDAGFDVYRAVRDAFVRAMRLAVETAQRRVMHA